MDRRHDWILFDSIAVAGRNSNATTATACTRNGRTIEVSFSLEHPPHPSIVFVHSSDMNLCVPPNIVRTVEDLLLLSVNLGSGPSSLSPDDCDYFIYRAHTSRPSLHRLEGPHPYFGFNDVGLLPRSDGQYAVAALIPTVTLDQYKLHVFHSRTKSWSCRTMSVKVPQQPFPPAEIPSRCSRLRRHLTSSVITIGGAGGTIGWVDHWRGILFCDVLDQEPYLRGVPIPLPMKKLASYIDGLKDFPFGPGWQRRGIAFVRDQGLLKLVHLEITDTRLAGKDPETGFASFKVDNWVLTTWSNKKMTCSYEDWHKDCMVQASDVTIDNPSVCQVLESGLLMHNHGAAGEQLALQNLSMSRPAHCVNGKDVVYLVARRKYKHPRTWILAVDVKNRKVEAVEEFGTQRYLDSSIIYCPSVISKYMMNPPPSTPDN